MLEYIFDVEITAGTEYGVLYDPYSGEVSGSLQNVLNGFRVLTSSSIAEDSVVIILKVRTRVGGGISTRVITNEKEETERRKIDKAEDKEPYNTERLIIGEEELEGYGNVLVKKDECDEYTCNEVIMKPSFTYESFPNGTFNADPCSTEQAKDTSVVAGITSVIWHEVNYLEYLKTENITACYEPVLGKWRFGTNKLLFPYFKIIMDVCLTNITNKGFKPLEDIADISDSAKWNDSNICEAKKDLERHRSYPGAVRPGGYIFLEVTMAHEMAHGQDFQWVIDSLQNAFLYPTLDSLEIHCGNYDIANRNASNKEEAKSVYLSEFQKIVMGETLNGVIIKNGFEQKLKEGYINHISQDFLVNTKIVDHENYINTRPIVVNTIDVLLNEFKNIWNCK